MATGSSFMSRDAGIYTVIRFMICCDQCEEWYHGDCVGISVAQGKRMERYGEDYVCMRCKGDVYTNVLIANQLCL